jgi:hypothetical protein
MARPESKMIMGYLPVDAHHHAALVALVAPGSPTHKLLDPSLGIQHTFSAEPFA